MSRIEAVFRRGAFEPLAPINLPEGTRVRLTIELIEKESPEEWLERVKKQREAFFEKHGYLPDSTADIAEDRLRD